MFTLRMGTYQGLFKEISVRSINVPTNDGRRGILPNHMAMVLPLCIGVVDIVDEDGHHDSFTIGNGLLCFEDNVAVLLSDVIENVTQIDLSRAEAAKRRAEEKLSQQLREADIQRAQVALARAANRIKAANRK
jgi:F-type H+-transporting ATPase subunit epsilon